MKTAAIFGVYSPAISNGQERPFDILMRPVCPRGYQNIAKPTPARATVSHERIGGDKDVRAPSRGGSIRTQAGSGALHSLHLRTPFRVYQLLG